MVIADPRRRLASHELLAALHLVAYWHIADLAVSAKFRFAPILLK
jgi:hypothetical protein